MKYKKIILPAILASSSVLVLYGVKAKFFIQTNITPNSDSSSINQTDENSNDAVYQKLVVISNRCRGCGKCVRIDSQHFEMSDGAAAVISSTNLDSSKLTLAINNCPAQAIILE